MDNRNGHVVYFENSSTGVQFGLVRTRTEFFCGHQFITTEHKLLFIVDLNNIQSFIMKKHIEFPKKLEETYFNTEISYLSKHITTQFENLYKDVLVHQ